MGLYVPICTNQAVHVKLIINKNDDDDDDEVLQVPLSHPRVKIRYEMLF